MNNAELDRALRTNLVTEPFFIGVFPANKIFNKTCGKTDRNMSCFLIVNTDNDDAPGEHWLMLFYDGRGCLEVFDPYGLAPHAYANMTDFFNARTKCTKYNKECVQSPLSNLCGVHCMFVAYHKCLNVTVSLKDILLKHYMNDVDFNDCLALAFVIDKFPNLGRQPVINRMKRTTLCK
jgi:hypothetical protein